MNEDGYPIIAKIYKQGNQLPIKEYKGQVEILDIVEVYEEMDAGTYIVELTNPVGKLQDVTFIFKQILKAESSGEDEKLFESKKTEENIEIDTNAISEEELKMYKTLDQAYKKINQFQVEQGLQQMRINKFLGSKWCSKVRETNATSYRSGEGEAEDLQGVNCGGRSDCGGCNIQRVLYKARAGQ